MPTRTLKPLMPRSRSSRAAYSCAPATILARPDGPFGVVLVGQGRAEKGQMASPISPRQRPFVAVDGRMSTSKAPFMMSIRSSGSSCSPMAVGAFDVEKSM